MIEIRKDSYKISEAYFWEWLMVCDDFKAKDYIKSQVAINTVEDAVKVLQSFKRDLEKAGVLNDI